WSQELAGQPVAEYQGRRQALMQRHGDGPIVVFGAGEEDFDEFARFRQSNDFMYLTGAERPGAILLLVAAGLVPDAGARQVLFLPPRRASREFWTGPEDGPGSEAQRKFGVAEVVNAERFYAILLDLLTGPPFQGDDQEGLAPARLYTPLARGPRAAESRAGRFAEAIRRIAPHVQLIDLAPALASMRQVKSPAELAILRRAIAITAEAQRDARRTIRPGAFEYEAQAALEAAFTRNGAERPGFFSIVGSGPNATRPHYHANRRRIEAGDLVVVDIGAEYHYYSADVTRTYPASGRFSPRQRAIYDVVLEAQHAAERAFRPGESTVDELQRAATQSMKASPARDAQGRTLDRHFPHGLGHWLGMDVHDVGDDDGPIPAGAVLTIEPGIYLPDEGIGVRIEDDYLVTPEGLVKLTGAIPSDADETERLMARPETGADIPADRPAGASP
ncbi:MAG TPA: Xaa-Pro peptidase family protein, partial [Isosphaeraceae bacterium]